MAAGKFSFMDIMNAQSKEQVGGTRVDKYTEIFLSPFEVKESESNFYSQDNIQELADSILTVGQQQPTVVGRINGEYKIISGHRRNLANKMLIDQGHEEYKKVRYLYRDMSEATLELSLLVGNAYNRELTAYEKTEQVARLKKALIRARDEDGLEIQGRLRDVLADLLNESPTNLARMESINKNLTEEAKEQFKAGNMGITAAYETSKLPGDEQKEIAEAADAGQDIRAKEIAAKVAERKAGEEYRTPHPESITSLCYSCLNYTTCNVKTGTCERCDEYINKSAAEKTDEQKYNEEQDAIDRATAKELKNREYANKLSKLPSDGKAINLHEIKISSTHYNAVRTGKKKFELRKNDRGYKEGDYLAMQEVNNGHYTGRIIDATITYMLEDYTGLEEGYCILGIEVKQSETDTKGKG